MHFPFVQFPTVITSGLSIGFATVCYLRPLIPFIRSPYAPLVPPPPSRASSSKQKLLLHTFTANSRTLLAYETSCRNTDFFRMRIKKKKLHFRNLLPSFNYIRGIDSIYDIKRELRNENLMKINTREILFNKQRK